MLKKEKTTNVKAFFFKLSSQRQTTAAASGVNKSAPDQTCHGYSVTSITAVVLFKDSSCTYGLCADLCGPLLCLLLQTVETTESDPDVIFPQEKWRRWTMSETVGAGLVILNL